MSKNTPFKSRTAQCGTLESSDCLVTISESETSHIDYRGANAGIFRKRTEAIVKELLDESDLTSVAVSIQDNGALEVTIRARIETAIERFLQGR
jgi:citrate lyase subunit gamma (acyl carrier protein)